MKTKTYNVYTFDELDEKGKEKALNNLRDINVDFDGWHEYILEDETLRLENLGYEDAKIYYSGFWSQGDGASFTATGNVQKLVPAPMQKYIDSISFGKSHRYNHEYTMSLDIDYIEDVAIKVDDLTVSFHDLEENLLENARKEAHAIYTRLSDEYDYRTSDESIKETIAANGYEFTIDGKLD